MKKGNKCENMDYCKELSMDTFGIHLMVEWKITTTSVLSVLPNVIVDV